MTLQVSTSVLVAGSWVSIDNENELEAFDVYEWMTLVEENAQ
jgi:hypothetical protein